MSVVFYIMPSIYLSYCFLIFLKDLHYLIGNSPKIFAFSKGKHGDTSQLDTVNGMTELYHGTTTGVFNM